jgi:hypothetical protein
VEASAPSRLARLWTGGRLRAARRFTSNDGPPWAASRRAGAALSSRVQASGRSSAAQAPGTRAVTWVARAAGSKRAANFGLGPQGGGCERRTIEGRGADARQRGGGRKAEKRGREGSDEAMGRHENPRAEG